MDLIRGTSMLDRLMADESGAVIPEMMDWFEKIHAVKGLRLPDLSEYLLNKSTKRLRRRSRRRLQDNIMQKSTAKCMSQNRSVTWTITSLT